jgi:predicted secreted Zn-dependent protease
LRQDQSLAGTLLLKSFFAVTFALVACLAWPAAAQSRSLKISENTRYYKISGKNAAEFALSMSRKGPYSRQHRRRAWATASRDMTYQLFHKKSKNSCRIKSAKVKLKITYQMPKLSSTKRVSKRQRRKWRTMYNLLNKHERTHGLYYRQFAKKVYASLLKLKSTKTCRSLERSAARLVAKLGEADKKRNQAFDLRDRRNYRSMERLYTGT